MTSEVGHEEEDKKMKERKSYLRKWSTGPGTGISIS
jgi:hypothetical protein